MSLLHLTLISAVLIKCNWCFTIKFPPVQFSPTETDRTGRSSFKTDINYPTINNLTDSWTFVLNQTANAEANKTEINPDEPKNFRVLFLLDLNFTNMERSYLPPATLTLTLDEDTAAKGVVSSDGGKPSVGTLTGTSHLIQDVIPVRSPTKGDGTEETAEQNEETQPERMWSFINFHANNVLQFNARVNMTQENVTYTVQTLTNDLHNPTLLGPGKFGPLQTQQIQPSAAGVAASFSNIDFPTFPSFPANPGSKEEQDDDDDSWRSEKEGGSLTPTVA